MLYVLIVMVYILAGNLFCVKGDRSLFSSAWQS